MWLDAIILTLAVASGWVMGFHEREMRDALRAARARLKAVVHKQPNRSSAILEPPLTPAEKVQREQEELIESLNRPPVS